MKQIFSKIFPSKKETRHLEKLLVLAQEIASQKGVEAMLQFGCEELHKIIGFACAVLILEGDNALKVRAAAGFPPAFKENLKVPIGEGKIWDSYSSGTAHNIPKKEILKSLSAVFPYDLEGEEFFVHPMVSGGQTLAAVLLSGTKQHPLTESTKEDLDPYVKVLSVGLSNIQNLERVEKFNKRLESEVAATTSELAQTNSRLIRRMREVKTLYELTLASGTLESLEHLFETTTLHLQDLFDVEYGAFFIDASAKEDSFNLVCQFPSFGLPKEVVSKIHMDPSLLRECGGPLKTVAEAYRTKEIQMYPGPAVSLQEALPWRLSSAHPEIFKRVNLRSLVAVPLQSAKRIFGVMALANFLEKPKGFAAAEEEFLLLEDEVRTLTLIAFRVASSIEAFRMDKEVQNRLVLLSTLQEISEVFYTNPLVEFVLDKVEEIVKSAMPCDFCDFLIADVSKEELQLHIPEEEKHLDEPPLKISLKDANSMSVQVFKEARSRIVADFSESPLSGDTMELGEEIHSLMLVPLRFGTEVLGVMKLGGKERNYFNSYHQRLAELIAERTAAILHSSRLYEKIVQTNKELERASQVKTEFVSIVSHELRTPVTALKGAIKLVLEGEAGQLNPHQAHLLKIANNSTERLIFLISDLLDISRIEAGRIRLKMAALSLNKVLSETEEIYYSSMQTKRLKFAVQVPDSLPLVWGDEFRVKQVIDNLLTNAMKFTPANGEVRISTESMGDFVMVSVSDSGIGIKPEDQKKIFDKFYQVDSSLSRVAGGTGLGLAICKSIVELHGGRIWVESQTGKGSVFRFILPKAK